MGVKASGCGAELTSVPWAVGKKCAVATWAEVGPVSVRMPSGAMVAGKGEGMVLGGVKTEASGEGPPVKGSVKVACSGMQMSEQTSHLAVATMLCPALLAVKGSRALPERT